MRAFRLHRGWREPNGLVTDHATLERVIKAASASDAMGAALAEGDFLLTDDTNLVWLIDDQGALVWSLRPNDENTTWVSESVPTSVRNRWKAVVRFKP